MSDNAVTPTWIQAMTQASQALVQGFQQVLDGQAGPATAFTGNTQQAHAEHQALQQEWIAKHVELWQRMARQSQGGVPSDVSASPSEGAALRDRRFSHPAWGESPLYDYFRQAYLINADVIRRFAETAHVPQGLTKERVRFIARQYADALAPSNFGATNPEFIKTALETQGESIKQGILNMIEDLQKGRISMTDESAFEVGKNLAISPGAVVYENELMQLIQYAPLTEKVARRPLVMVPPCINKYYIMDLQPANSLVRFAVEQGHTVFLISWRNPSDAQKHMRWDDYVEQGPLAAIGIAQEMTRSKTVNVLGFCVGGTLLSTALAVLKARGEDSVASLTFMTTLLDFSDPGELGCFIDEASVVMRETTIGKGGLLRGQELASVFSMLRANDLIWQYVVSNYLKGGKPAPFDLLYWNSDATNVPGPFLAWYLRNMYLENKLRIPGKIAVCGEKIDLRRLDMPTYFMAAMEDHIVPWRTAYLGRELLGGPTTFVLGASGHIAGAINPASKNKRSFWVNEADASSADQWLAQATEMPGSWWNHWAAWLKNHAGGETKARALGSKKYPVIEPAPGRYVKERI
jgi:polyhydroxyalkanoate synthase